MRSTIGLISFIFMHFSGKILGWSPHLGLAPNLENPGPPNSIDFDTNLGIIYSRL